MIDETKRDEIRESLMEQLVKSGADIDVLVDMVDQYIELWEISQLLTADIQERGVTYTEESARGVPMVKSNPSVKEKVGVNKQMLQILLRLKITSDLKAEVRYEPL